MNLSTSILAILLFEILVLYSNALQESRSLRIMEVSCNSSGVSATIQLPSNFSGVIYSLNNFFNPSCRYDANPVPRDMNFSLFLPINNCGILIEEMYGYIHFSSVIVLQKYNFVETTWDELHNVSCKILRHEAKRSFESENSSYRFINNLKLWMELKNESDVFGAQQINKLIVGDDVLVVIQLEDSGQNKDLYVESCWAYEGETVAQSKYVMQIFDSHICQSSDWMTDFNTTGGIPNLSNIMTYATFKTFKFPSTEKLKISCSVLVCRQDCLRNCNFPTEVGKTDNFQTRKFVKRSASPSISSKSANERLKLMKATIKALGASLLKSRTNRRFENAADFYKRKSQPSSTDLLLDNDGGVIGITSAERDDFNSTIMIDISTIDSTENTSKYVAAMDLTAGPSNDTYNFNLTMNLVVLSNRDANFSYVFRDSKFGPDCVPRLRFSLVTSMLCFILFCLILTCIALILYLRKEKKKHLVDNFLLYNFY